MSSRYNSVDSSGQQNAKRDMTEEYFTSTCLVLLLHLNVQ
jgi:hypothetical protein